MRAPGGGRTHTWTILSRLPLPLGYRGHFRVGKSTCLFYHRIQLGARELSRESILLARVITTDDQSSIPVAAKKVETGPMAKLWAFSRQFFTYR